MPDDLTRCAECGVWTSNADHVCVEYDPNFPCDECGKGTVYVFLGAPGSGQGRICPENHYAGTSQELTLADVI